MEGKPEGAVYGGSLMSEYSVESNSPVGRFSGGIDA
jgi:hypothetical protein